MELTKIDYKKLEDYIENMNKYKRDLKFREYEVLSNHEPTNPEGAKTNIVSSPVENRVIKLDSDNKYRKLKEIVDGLERFLAGCDEDTLEMLRLKYWDKPIGCNTWDTIAPVFYTSKTGILRHRTAKLNQLAEYIVIC
ncbi:transcriptional regulator [Staphylococcus xylosus]